MSNPGDSAAEEALLMELAQLSLGMARQLHQAALATRDAQVLVPLANAYHKVSRGMRQCLALRARFAAGTVAPERTTRTEATPSTSTPRPEVERADWNDRERPDWNERFATEPLERLGDDPDVCRAHIRRDLTVVSRTPALAAIPALQPHAATLASRAALLGSAPLRLVDTS